MTKPIAGMPQSHRILGAVLNATGPDVRRTRFDDPQFDEPLQAPAPQIITSASPFQEVKINVENAAQFGTPISGNRAAELSLRPVLAAHELNLGPLHAEALRLLCKHNEEPTSYTFSRLMEAVNLVGIKIGGTVHF